MPITPTARPRRSICAAFGGTDGALVNMVNVAEVDEVMMANQAAGWNCGASAGEGLSRVLSTQRYPAELDGFASASSWLNSARPDWVTNTEPTDQDYVSIGCATLFLNYLRYRLHFSLVRIVEAGGTTLQQTYQSLTGSTDAFGPFAALLQRFFPAGTTSQPSERQPVSPASGGELGRQGISGRPPGVAAPCGRLGTQSSRHFRRRIGQRSVAPLVGMAPPGAARNHLGDTGVHA